MRLNNSIKNIKFSLISHVLNIIIQFVTRTVFIYTLGSTYLGVNGLFTNILTILSLADLGIGSVLTYTMYEPLANKNEKKLAQLVQEYRRIYNVIALFIFSVGIILIPFLPIFIKDDVGIQNLNFIYFLYLLNTVVSYLCIYKTSIITADQKDYIVKIYQQVINLVANILMIIFLLIFKQFIVYLFIKIGFSILGNIIISKKAERMYPSIQNKKIERLSKDERNGIYSNTFAMMLHKVGGVVVSGTDNILISSMISIITVGIYSNYSMIISTIKGIISQIFNSITASIGNLTVMSNEEHAYDIFKKTFFINFWTYGFCSITLFSLLNPFIYLWIGEEYVFDSFTVFLIVMVFFVDGMRQTVQIFRNSYGIFKQDKIKPLIEASLNLFISIACTMKFGINGIFIGTILSMILACTFEEPYFLYKFGFKDLSKLKEYYYLIIKYYIIVLISMLIVHLISLKLTTTITVFFIKGVLTVILTNLLFIMLFKNTKEFKYFFELLKNIVYKVKNKLK